MSKKQDKAAKRKAKLKTRKVHAEQARLMLVGRIANAAMVLCATIHPEYMDDSKNLIVVWGCETTKKNFPPQTLLDFVNSNHHNTAISEE